MSRRKKIAAIIMATLITGTGLVGCGSSKEDNGKETITSDYRDNMPGCSCYYVFWCKSSCG